MDAGLLEKMLGGNRVWSGPCVVILDAEASVKTPGPDSIMGGGLKAYAPRFASGRLEADTCCLVKEYSALFIVQQQSHKDGTGEQHIKQKLISADLKNVVGLEFSDTSVLRKLGLPAPFIPEDTEYRPGVLVG